MNGRQFIRPSRIRAIERGIADLTKLFEVPPAEEMVLVMSDKRDASDARESDQGFRETTSAAARP